MIIILNPWRRGFRSRQEIVRMMMLLRWSQGWHRCPNWERIAFSLKSLTMTNESSIELLQVMQRLNLSDLPWSQRLSRCMIFMKLRYWTRVIRTRVLRYCRLRRTRRGLWRRWAVALCVTRFTYKVVGRVRSVSRTSRSRWWWLLLQF